MCVCVCVRYNRSRGQTAADLSSGGRPVTHWQDTGSSSSAMSRLVARLNDMTDKLQNAYSGVAVSWSTAGQYVESVLLTCSHSLTHSLYYLIDYLID